MPQSGRKFSGRRHPRKRWTMCLICSSVSMWTLLLSLEPAEAGLGHFTQLARPQHAELAARDVLFDRLVGLDAGDDGDFAAHQGAQPVAPIHEDRNLDFQI